MLASIQAFILAFYVASIMTLYLAWYLASILTVSLTWPLRSGAHRWSPTEIWIWGPAVPTEIWGSRLRSGNAHWDLEGPGVPTEIEVRQCPLRSGARSWGPAVPTEIWSPQLGRKEEGGGRRRKEEEGGGRRKEEEVTLIKSRDPYLAGGEKHDFLMLPLSPPFQKNPNLIVSWTQLLLFAFSTLPYRKSQIHCLEIMFLGFPHGFSVSFLCIWVCLKIMGTTPNSVV